MSLKTIYFIGEFKIFRGKITRWIEGYVLGVISQETMKTGLTTVPNHLLMMVVHRAHLKRNAR